MNTANGDESRSKQVPERPPEIGPGWKTRFLTRFEKGPVSGLSKQLSSEKRGSLEIGHSKTRHLLSEISRRYDGELNRAIIYLDNDAYSTY